MKLKALVLITSALICSAAVLAVTSISSKAETAQKSAPECYYTAIKLKSGDTLNGIAETYNTSEFYSQKEYIELVKQINGLHTDDIHAGCYLTIACYD